MFAYLGRTFESEGCWPISESLPYLRNNEYNVSCVNSAAEFSGDVGRNSTLTLALGRRYKSSIHGFPCTKKARTLRKGLNHGVMGFSSRYAFKVLSSSFTLIPSSCENFTKAPPSRSLGRILFTVRGSFSGRARLMMLEGSARARSGWFTLLSELAKNLSGLRYGIRFSHCSFKGKTSRTKSADVRMDQERDALTVEEEYPLILSGLDVACVVISSFS